MIRFGPGGIPLSCKGRTLRDAVEDVHKLGLTALEVQLVRTNMVEQYAVDEVGQIPTEVEGELIVEVLRKDNGSMKSVPFDKPIEGKDILRRLTSGLARDYFYLREVGEIAKDLDITLSIHTPYYIELAGDKSDPLTERTINSIKWAGVLGKAMDGTHVVTHAGLYPKGGKKDAINYISKNLKEVLEWYKMQKVNLKLGVETSGKQEVFGAVDEVLALTKKCSIVPIINFAHVHAREGGSLREKEDFQRLIDKVRSVARDEYLYTHFSGVEHEGGNEKRLTPIKKGSLRFEPLAECILDNEYEMTIISSSPLLEHDAMYMKVLLERAIAKRVTKDAKKNGK